MALDIDLAAVSTIQSRYGRSILRLYMLQTSERVQSDRVALPHTDCLKNLHDSKLPRVAAGSPPKTVDMRPTRPPTWLLSTPSFGRTRRVRVQVSASSNWNDPAGHDERAGLV